MQHLIEILVVMTVKVAIELGAHSLIHARAAPHFVFAFKQIHFRWIVLVHRAEPLMRHRHDLPLIQVVSIALNQARFAFDEGECLAELDVLLVDVLAIIFLIGSSDETAPLVVL